MHEKCLLTFYEIFLPLIQSNLAIRNGLIRNKLVLRNHFLWPICHLLHKDKELLALRNNFRATKKFLIAKFDCSSKTAPRILIFSMVMGADYSFELISIETYAPQFIGYNDELFLFSVSWFPDYSNFYSFHFLLIAKQHTYFSCW